MKIVHLCLSNFYIDGHSYQENELVRQHVRDGHEVSVVASTETFDSKKQLSFTTSGSYLGSDGAPVTRLPYDHRLPHRASAKLRFYEGLPAKLEELRPDVLMCHGISGGYLYDVAKYKRAVPEVRVFADTHADANNSATNVISRLLLHRLFYRRCIQSTLSTFEKILCISLETMDFARDVYDIPETQLEFFPLGGVVFDDFEYLLRRSRFRSKIGVQGDAVVLAQSGKFDEKKKLIEALQAFSTGTSTRDLCYVVAGHVSQRLELSFRNALDADGRIKFIGWQDSEGMKDVLCGADVYVQPGSQSATMQMSLSARCAVIIAKIKAHGPYENANGWFVDGADELRVAMSELESNPSRLASMSANSHAIASRLLDYRALAARFY